MRLSNGGFIYKSFGVARFFLIYLYYITKNISWLGLIGKGNLIAFNGNVFIGKKLITGKNVDIISDGELYIGRNVSIGDYSRIVSKFSIKIGSNVMLARFVSILDHDHGYTLEDSNMKFDGYTTDSIEIGDNVWIGDKVTILKGVKIGSNVIVAANSVVTKSIPSNCIVAGTPAVIKRVI
ncbi:acyltransferase [Shewanella baltica]|uniref:acyltransferase n=1 Tax=Shewanella baltica TaxID=62322 RepID=UPI00217E4221|nr:acyltransferase [Shewanella baltica]MCS6095023.1 acyltransferase [Shewanella baltica]MCS6226131.1 acyltransferase [Shewanella baltica]